jgi:N-acetylneuraminic acid mutarotase
MVLHLLQGGERHLHTYRRRTLASPLAGEHDGVRRDRRARGNTDDLHHIALAQHALAPRRNGVYGTQGTQSAGNVPGARNVATSWTDAAGNLWLFGGSGPSNETAAYFNDLWKFNPSAQTWTWVSGSDSINAFGVYGTQGTASAGNVPGARYFAASWADHSGNFWLFGGTGYSSTGQYSSLNDLWKFAP